MKPPTTKTFVVEGSGEFPKEMLHYDSAKAATPDDQRIIDAEYGVNDDIFWDTTTKRMRRNRVTLVTTTPRYAPTVARWQSFTWRVVPRAEVDNG
jgi:hypothetical protein